MMTQNHTTADFIALRTVPILLKNGDPSLKVNVFFRQGTYLNADVAADLGLHGRTEKVTVNVQVETFDTKPVGFELLRIDREINMNLTAYTQTE